LYNIDDFVTDAVWRQLLQLHLKATDQQKLKKNGVIINKLCAFTRQAVKEMVVTIENNGDTQSVIKKLDNYTINLKIPTKLGIVELLPVQELLDNI
jgi:hypothetical protein